MFNLKSFLKRTLPFFILATLSLILSLIFSYLNFDRAEMLMLDFKQNLFPLNPKDSPIQIVNLDVQDMVPTQDKKDDYKFPYLFVEKKIKKILDAKPKKLLVVLSPEEVEFTLDSEKQFAQLLNQYPQLYLYFRTITNSSKSAKNEYKNHLTLAKHPKTIEFSFFTDRAYPPYDIAVRRVLLAYLKPKYTINDDAEHLASTFQIQLEPKKYSGCYSYWDTTQCLLRLENVQSRWFMNEANINYRSLKDKIVFLAIHNLFNYQSTHSIFWDPNPEKDTNALTYPDSLLLASYLDNLMNDNFVIPASLLTNQLWLFVVILSLLITLYYLDPRKVISAFFAILGIVAFVPILAFAVRGYHLSMIPELLVCTIIGLVVIPWRFHRFITVAQKNELESAFEKQMVSTRAKLLTQSVVYETKNKLYLRLLHDLASPIFALKVVSKNIDNKGLDQELKILNGSIERFEKLSAELRGNKGDQNQDETLYNLTAGCKEILKIFQDTFKEVQFILEAPPSDIYCEFDKFVFERSLSNLLKNSVEALDKIPSEKRIVLLQIQNHGQNIDVLVNDSGLGIPEQIQQRLFQMGATFGKATGSGIGLNQVKDDLESRGAYIQLTKGPYQGAAFLISLKKSAVQNKIFTQGTFILADDDAHFLKYMATFIPQNCEQHLFTDPIKALEFIKQEVSKNKPITLITDLFFEKSNLTGIDLLSLISHSNSSVKILVTSLGHLPEILQLGESVHATVISKAQFARYSFQQK